MKHAFLDTSTINVIRVEHFVICLIVVSKRERPMYGPKHRTEVIIYTILEFFVVTITETSVILKYCILVLISRITGI